MATRFVFAALLTPATTGDDGRVLLIESVGSQGKWRLPGSLVETGRHPGTVLREVMQLQTGLEISDFTRMGEEGEQGTHAFVCGRLERGRLERGVGVVRLAHCSMKDLIQGRIRVGAGEGQGDFVQLSIDTDIPGMPQFISDALSMTGQGEMQSRNGEPEGVSFPDACTIIRIYPGASMKTVWDRMYPHILARTPA